MHHALIIDNHNIDTFQTLNHLQSLFGPEHENRRGEAVGCQRILADNGHALDTLDRFAGLRRQNVMNPFSRLIHEEPLVVAGGGHCHILERQNHRVAPF